MTTEQNWHRKVDLSSSIGSVDSDDDDDCGDDTKPQAPATLEDRTSRSRDLDEESREPARREHRSSPAQPLHQPTTSEPVTRAAEDGDVDAPIRRDSPLYHGSPGRSSSTAPDALLRDRGRGDGRVFRAMELDGTADWNDYSNNGQDRDDPDDEHYPDPQNRGEKMMNASQQKEHQMRTPSLGATIAGVAGNVLEWYDFAVFGYLSDVLGQVFFPPGSAAEISGSNSSSRNATTIQAFAVFGAAFIMRPLGGLWLGYVGDRVGRKSALVSSIFFMAVPTFALGCLPTYRQVGPVAVLLLVAVRLLQGLSVGGQLMSSLVFTLEQHPRRHWGWYGSCVMASANVGSLLGSLVGFALRAALTPDQLRTWGWRIPFLAGILVGGAGCYLRSNGDETEIVPASRQGYDLVHHHRPPDSPPPANENPICLAVHPDNVRSLLAASLVPILWSGGFYMTFVWMAVYMSTLVDVPVPHAFGVNTVAMLLSLCLFFPVAGLASDRMGRRPVMTAGGFGCALLGPLATRWISASGDGGVALVGQLALGIAVACWGAPMCAWLVEAFEPRARLTSVNIGYNAAQAVAGGASPALATYVVDRWGPGAPGWLYTVLSCLALTGLWIVAPHSSRDETPTMDVDTSLHRRRRCNGGDFVSVPRSDEASSTSTSCTGETRPSSF